VWGKAGSSVDQYSFRHRCVEIWRGMEGDVPANPLISRLASTAQLRRLVLASSRPLTREGGKVIIAIAFLPLTKLLKACRNLWISYSISILTRITEGRGGWDIHEKTARPNPPILDH
jgi:hypothetical protein